MISPAGVQGRQKEIRPDEPLPVVEGLVDSDLTPEAQAARTAADLALIEPPGLRAVAVFLGRSDYEKVAEFHGDTMARLLMASLRVLVRQLGGRAVMARLFANGLRRDDPVNAIQTTVEVNGRAYAVLVSGHLFVHLPEEKIVVSVEPCDGGISRITVRSNRDSAAFFRKWKVFTQDHNYLRGQAFFADGEVITRQRRYSWDDILLPWEVRRAVETHVQGFLRNRRRLRGLGVKGRRGLILAGPPGTGKTLLGKVLADTLDCSFLWVSPRHIESPKSFQEILKVARFVSPTVLFLEDLDIYAVDRDAHGWLGLGELLNQMDGAVDNEDLVTIATTNRLEVIEKALRNRPGRFDRVLRLEEMDEACRRRMLERLLAKAAVLPEDLDRLVSETAGYTGAQVEELSNTIIIFAVDRPDATSGNGDGDPDAVRIDRSLIAAALEEIQVELKGRVGFHAK